MHSNLIITRFDEDLDWLNLITNTNINITIQNKGNDIYFQNRKISINKITNSGKESFGYLKYIVENYDDLSEFNLFLQAEPFEHCINENLRWASGSYKEIIISDTMLDNYQNSHGKILFEGKYLDKENKSRWRGFQKINQVQINKKVHSSFCHGDHNEIRPINLIEYINNGIFKSDILGDVLVHGNYPSYVEHYLLSQYFEKTDYDEIFSKLTTNDVTWMAGSQYCLSKSQILFYPKDFYEKILRSYSDLDSNYICNSLEKILFYIFFTHQKIELNYERFSKEKSFQNLLEMKVDINFSNTQVIGKKSLIN